MGSLRPRQLSFEGSVDILGLKNLFCPNLCGRQNFAGSPVFIPPRGPPVASDAKPIIHRGVALMICENAAILEETLISIDLSGLDIQRIGGRAIVAPAYQLQPIRRALQERGMFPKLIGDIIQPDYFEQQDALAQAERLAAAAGEETSESSQTDSTEESA